MFPVGSAKNHADAKEKILSVLSQSITPVTEKSCLGRQGVSLDVALQLATGGRGCVNFRTRRRGSDRQGGCQRTSHASGGRRGYCQVEQSQTASRETSCRELSYVHHI